MSSGSAVHPRAELLRALAALAEAPTDAHRRVARTLGLGGGASDAAYTDVFLFNLYPYASVHVGEEGMMGGEARSRISGFWRAVGRVPPTESDHLGALVALYAALAESAEMEGGADGVLARQAADALLQEHVASWVFPFLARVSELAGGFYGRWARLLADALQAEVRKYARGGFGTLPVHLREAPRLPDPRAEGVRAFADGLLAPVRTGMILTRADLARVARATGVGLRAGERRYALEHMLVQDAAGVLGRLAGEARERQAQHDARVSWLGAPARFHADRAGATARLLAALAEPGAVALDVDEGASDRDDTDGSLSRATPPPTS